MNPQQQIEALCKKLKPILGNQADILWHMYLSEDEKDRRKFAQDIEIIAEKFLKNQPLENPRILLEPPLTESSKGKYLIGDIVYNKKKLHSLHLNPEDFIKQIGIFAITGEGKTNLAYLLALQLLKSKTPFTVIDWKRSWRNLLSAKDKHPELNNVQVFTIGRDTLPFLWNVFQAPPGTDKKYWISTIADTLEKSHLSGPGVAYHFNKIFLKLFKDLPDDFYPNFHDAIKELQNTKVTARELNWKQTAQRIFQSLTLGNASKVFNTRKPMRLEDILKKPVIFELDLEMPKALRVFLSEIILKWIHLYRLSQGESDKLKHILFLEEVHNLFPRNNFYKDNSSIENIYREVRGFGQGLVSITQHPSLLPIELLGNCHTQIYLGLQHADDITTARKSLFLNYDEDFYLNALKIGECIVKIKNRVEPCLVKTPLVHVSKEVVTDDWLKIHHLNSMFMEYVWKDSPSQKPFDWNTLLGNNSPDENKDNPIGNYPPQTIRKTHTQGRNRINASSRREDNRCVNIKDKKRNYPHNTRPQHKLLIDILEYPFSGITERYRRLNFHPKPGNKYRKDIISEKCARAVKVITGTGWITLFELTKKGKMVLTDLGYEFKNESEGVVHKFWKHRVSEYYRRKGFDVSVEEYYVNGRPDIIVRKGDKKVAIEIETGKSDYVKNVKRALEAGFDEVVCVAVNGVVEGKVARGLKVQRILDGRVRIVGVRGFG